MLIYRHRQGGHGKRLERWKLFIDNQTRQPLRHYGKSRRDGKNMQNLFIDGYAELKQQIANGKEEIPFLKKYIEEVESAEYDEEGISLDDYFTREENEASIINTTKQSVAIEKMLEGMEEFLEVYS